VRSTPPRGIDALPERFEPDRRDRFVRRRDRGVTYRRAARVDLPAEVVERGAVRDIATRKVA
jgi:hypothetical protein